jgi:hypothetical protein
VSGPSIVGLDAAGTPAAWTAAGFAVVDDVVTIGGVAVRVDCAPSGIRAWTLFGVPRTTDVDGLPTRVVDTDDVEPADHPNGATLIDHLVVWSPDDERTIAAMCNLGFEVRRVRTDARPGFRQTFLRAGDVIVELVAADRPPAGGPARFFGIACTVADLDATASLLGEALGAIKDAVQPGRRIVTLRGRELGLDVAIAFMSPEPRN